MNRELKPHVQGLARALLRHAHLRGRLLAARVKAGDPKNGFEAFLFDFAAELRDELRARVK